MPPFAMRPLWPLMVGAREPSGADGAQTDEAPVRAPAFDPIRMMLELMHQAVQERLAQQQPQAGAGAGAGEREEPMSRGESAKPVAGAQPPTGLQEPSPMGLGSLLFGLNNNNNNKPPGAANETKQEEVVEIEGKKYLKKTVVNRHVGDNIFFMTRRLVFIPLNETDSQPSSTVVPETVSSTSAPASEQPPKAEEKEKEAEGPSGTQASPSTTEAVATEQPITPTSSVGLESTTTTTTTTVAAVTKEAEGEQEATTKPSEEATKPEPSDKAAERLVVADKAKVE